MSEPILTFDRVSKTYEESVFSDISFELEIGKSVCVMAPSGRGKSTLLSIAGLLLKPTSGKVFIEGVCANDLNDDEISKIRSEKIGFLFQHTQLCASLRANENISLPSFFNKDESKLPKQEVDASIDKFLKRFDLEKRKFYYPNQLSVGQKRRIACARALFSQPKLIIADEPTNDLDEKNKQIVVEALFEPIKKQKAGLLYATHDEKVSSLADKIIKL